MNNYLPITLNITHKKILIIGGGAVCMHKIAAVMQFSNDITIVSESFLPAVRDYGFPCITKSYDKADLEGFSIVFACTNNREINKIIHHDAHEKGLLINVADDKELCDFISPAIFKEGAFSIAVSSSGTAVLKAVKIRNYLQKTFKGIMESLAEK